VIGADDAPAIAAALQQPHHPVQADIGEAADAAVLAADGDDRLIVDRIGQVVAGIGDLRGQAGA
jgi:hypothetical protein